MDQKAQQYPAPRSNQHGQLLVTSENPDYGETEYPVTAASESFYG